MEKKEEFSEENHNLEVLEEEDEKNLNKKSEQPKEKEKRGNLFIGTLNIIARPLKDRHEKHYRESTFHLVVDGVLVFVILILLGTFLFFYFWQPKQDIKMEITTANIDVLSGKEETFTIKYAHEGDRRINKSALAVDLPRNFVLKKVVPENIFDKQSNTFKLGELSAGANGEVEITGQILGEVGSRQTLSTSFNYLVGDREIKKLSSLNYNIEGSALDVESEAPATIYKGGDFNWFLRIKNEGDVDYDEIIIKLNPGPWELKNVNCADNCEWDRKEVLLKGFKAGSDKNISLTASTGADKGEHIISTNFFAKTGDLTFKQGKRSQRVKVIDPDLKLNINPDKKVTKIGEKVAFSLNYSAQNKNIKDLQLALSSASKDFRLKDYKVLNKENIETEAEKVYLGDLEKGGSGSIKIETEWSRSEAKTNQALTLLCRVNYDSGQEKVAFTKSSDSVKMLSDLNISSNARYYSGQGDQLGIGPLPPKAGIPTSYWVFWEADNFGNELQDFTVTAQLPEKVTWTGNKTVLSGKLMYGAISNQVAWEMGKIEPEAKGEKVGFEVELLPGEENVGEVMSLLKNIEYKAKDKFCDTEIKGTLESMDTNLEDDDLVDSEGRVRSFNE